MYKIALTGSRLSGKDTACKEFEMFGIPIFDADLATKFLIHYNSNIINQIEKKFGGKAYKTGFLDKDFFDSDVKMNALLDIVQNDLLYFYSEFIKKNQNPYAYFTIFKCSYFFERNLNIYKELRMDISTNDSFKSSSEYFFDGVINVHTPDDLREFRAFAYPNKIRIKSGGEISPEKKKESATFNIDSFPGSDKTVKDQVREIVSKLNNKYKPIPYQI